MVWSSSGSKVEAGGGAASRKMLIVSSAANSTQVNLNFQEKKEECIKTPDCKRDADRKDTRSLITRVLIVTCEFAQIFFFFFKCL